MEKQVQPYKTRKPGRIPLMACIALFALFFANLFIGKANIHYELNLPHMGNLAEFLLMAAASTLLIVAALEREAAEKVENNQPTEVKE
jgi:hypothetical protein